MNNFLYDLALLNTIEAFKAFVQVVADGVANGFKPTLSGDFGPIPFHNGELCLQFPATPTHRRDPFLEPLCVGRIGQLGRLKSVLKSLILTLDSVQLRVDLPNARVDLGQIRMETGDTILDHPLEALVGAELAAHQFLHFLLDLGTFNADTVRFVVVVAILAILCGLPGIAGSILMLENS